MPPFAGSGDIADFGWSSITLLNSWTQLAGATVPPISYRNTANFIWFRGEIVPPAGLSFGGVMFNLPSAIRRSTYTYKTQIGGLTTLGAPLMAQIAFAANRDVSISGLVLGGLANTIASLSFSDLNFPL